MKVILLAAGSATRLGKITKKIPKALLDINGKSLLEWQIFALKKNDISNIIVITGPHKEKFSLDEISCLHDKNYEKHDVLGSLMEASTLLNTDVIISYTDIVFDENIIRSMLDFEGDIGLAVEMDWKKAYVGRTEHPIEEAANVLIENNVIKKIGHDTTRFGNFDQKNLGEFLGIMKLSKLGCNILKKEYIRLLKTHKGPFHEADSLDYAYITDMTQELIDIDIQVLPIIVKGKWCEIDTKQDLEQAREIFR